MGFVEQARERDAENARLRDQLAEQAPQLREQDKAVAAARRSNPAADNAAQAITIYKLQRKGAPGLDITVEEESPAAGGR